MSEYWKSTPRYWCKHCSVYVRDTKLERTNHEATGRHQGNVKRALRDLHRGHEQQEREVERAKREVERLNGIVAGSSSAGPSSYKRDGGAPDAAGARDRTGMGGGAAEASRQKQLEQLAELGVNIPEPLRGDMALAGEWTVTNTRILEDRDDDGNKKTEALATGVRKRERTENETEEDNTIKALLKKPRRWGRDSKALPEEDEDLDKLLGGLVRKEDAAKKEEGSEGEDMPLKTEEGAGEEGEDEKPVVEGGPSIKREPTEGEGGSVAQNLAEVPDVKTEKSAGGAEHLAVVFKKRKSKNVRQK